MKPKTGTSDIPPMHAKLYEFLTTGELPPSSRERNLLLDLARVELSQNPGFRVPEINLTAIRGNTPSIETKLTSIK